MLDKYRSLRVEGYNPAWHFEKFYKLLSYGTAWGQGAEIVVPEWRDKKNTRDTFAEVLLKPGAGRFGDEDKKANFECRGKA